MVIEASTPGLRHRLPQVRGRLTPMRPLADLTWFRVGWRFGMSKTVDSPIKAGRPSGRANKKTSIAP